MQSTITKASRQLAWRIYLLRIASDNYTAIKQNDIDRTVVRETYPEGRTQDKHSKTSISFYRSGNCRSVLVLNTDKQPNGAFIRYRIELNC